MKAVKKLRKMYRKKIDSMAVMDLKKTIFRLARHRDILGIILILENIVLAVLIFYFLLFRY